MQLIRTLIGYCLHPHSVLGHIHTHITNEQTSVCGVWVSSRWYTTGNNWFI